MANTREVVLRTFSVQTARGRRYVVIEYQQYVSTAGQPNPDAEIPGLRRLATSEGMHVNNLDSETFQIVETNEVVRKV